MPLSKTSLAVLKSVKKSGKPAHFVLVANGSTVEGLEIYRKGTLDAAKTRARDGASGKVSEGVVEGQGNEITFKLLREHFPTEPTTPAKLKVFLNTDETKFKLLPKVELVDDLPAVSAADDDDASSGSDGASQGYRTGDQWRAILAVVPTLESEAAKAKVCDDADQWLREETAAAKIDPDLASDARDAQLASIAKVQTAILAIRARLKLPPDASRPQPAPQIAPQVAPVQPVVQQPVAQPIVQRPVGAPPGNQPARQRRVGGPQAPPPNANTALRQAAAKRAAERKQMVDDTSNRVAKLNTPLASPLKPAELKQAMVDCDCDPKDTKSDFVDICNKFNLDLEGRRVRSHEVLTSRLAQTKNLAASYIAGHQENKLGLPKRIQKRNEYCARFLKEVAKVEQQIDERNTVVNAMCDTYQALVNKNQSIPFKVISEMETLALNILLTPATVAKVRALVDSVRQRTQAEGYQELAKLTNPSPQESASVMLEYGCYTAALGGTSDVRLLRNPDRSVAYAFKNVQGESGGALGMLGLPEGACAVREDLCSSVNEFLKTKGVDLGFPKSELTEIDGMRGALIEGIRGSPCDPEELAQMHDAPQAEQDAALQKFITLPDQITPESLQKVVLFSVFTCQWDCKWGNLLVEGDKARPLDGGAAFPTQKTVDDFADTAARAMSMEMLTIYPMSGQHPKSGQPLPAAQQPMDAALVKSLLAIKADEVAAAMKARRDELQLKFPGMNVSALLDDASIERTRMSTMATQTIIRANPQITLADFVQKYTKWVMNWMVASATKKA